MRIKPAWTLIAAAGLTACTAGDSGISRSVDAALPLLDLTESQYGPTLTIQLPANDSRRLDVLFDTGAGVTVLDRKAVAGMEFEALADVNVGSGGTSAARARLLKSDFRFKNGAVTKDAALLVFDLASRGGPFAAGIEGILSPSALPFLLVEIDFARGIVRPASSSPQIPGTDFSAPAYGLPQSTIQVAGEEIVAVIDSGARDFLSLPIAWTDRVDFLEPPIGTGSARTVVEESEILTGTLDGDVVIGGKTFRNPRISFDPAQSLALIGMEALRQFNVTLDYGNGKAWIAPAQSE